MNLSLKAKHTLEKHIMSRSSQQKCSLRKGVLRNFTKFMKKYLCQSLFFNKVIGLRTEACNFIKKETLAQVFSDEFCEISMNTLFKEHVWKTTSACHIFPERYRLRLKITFEKSVQHCTKNKAFHYQFLLTYYFNLRSFMKNQQNNIPNSTVENITSRSRPGE